MYRFSCFTIMVVCFMCLLAGVNMALGSVIGESMQKSTVEDLVASHGESQRSRIEKGVHQVAQFWMEEDGSPDEFAAFCDKYFIADPDMFQETADRYEVMFESICGRFRDKLWVVDPVDPLFICGILVVFAVMTAPL